MIPAVITGLFIGIALTLTTEWLVGKYFPDVDPREEQYSAEEYREHLEGRE